MRARLKLLPLGEVKAFQDELLIVADDQDLSLGDFLARFPAAATEPLEDGLLARKLGSCFIQVLETVDADRAVYLPPRSNGSLLRAGVAGAGPDAGDAKPSAPEKTSRPNGPPDAATVSDRAGSLPERASEAGLGHPQQLGEREAVGLAYGQDIQVIASYLRAGLSVLIVCDKLVVPYLWSSIPAAAGRHPVLLGLPTEDASEGMGMGRGLRQKQLAHLKTLIGALHDDHVLVVPHLDLLAGGAADNLTTEARELVELLYHVEAGTRQGHDPLILAFADPSLALPEVLSSRFAVRFHLSGVPREVTVGAGPPRPLGQAMVTADEAAKFTSYQPDELYKNVAGMNPVRLRQAIVYAVNEFKARPGGTRDLVHAIRMFKTKTSANFEVPNVKFDDIGGYRAVKAELMRALTLMVGAYGLPDGVPPDLQRELIPRGFLFHGPPGTGKTLFAKAIANFLNATIQVVSGPEVTDMYVGESERKLREIFAEARRNAPAVVVFDEFDSIASKRSGREDGGSRAGNAIVAQILTEMDGFRPDVPMLVIGTTNRLDIIDEALLRPSRFRAVHIDLPDPDARRAIADIHARHFRIALPPGMLDVVAHATVGLNGDEIRAVFRDACVGQYCQAPAVAADAYRLGYLVGELRDSLQKREQSAAANRPAGASVRRSPDPGRPAPSGDTWVPIGGSAVSASAGRSDVPGPSSTDSPGEPAP
jgi:transitional endoplasmic reticulum ATPase